MDKMLKEVNINHPKPYAKLDSGKGATEFAKVESGFIKKNTFDNVSHNEYSSTHGTNKGLYNSHEVKVKLEQKYQGEVTSSTLPKSNAPNVKLAGESKVFELDGITHKVPFDFKGFPIFDKYIKYETRIPHEIAKIDNSRLHMTTATKELHQNILNGKIDASQFTEKQLTQISSGKPHIDNLTWHHHQDAGRMQLISRDVHNKTSHIGSMGLNYDKKY